MGITKHCLFLVLLLTASACTQNPSPGIRVLSASPRPTTDEQLQNTPTSTIARNDRTAIQASSTQGVYASTSSSLTPSPVSALTTTSTSPLTFNLNALTEINRIQYEPYELVLDLAYSPDGELLAVSAGDSIYLYNAETLTILQQLPTGTWSVSLAFSPDNRMLASGGRDGVLKLWDVTKGELRSTIEAHKKGVNSVTFSPDGRILASGGNDAVARLWDTSSGEMIAEMIGGTFAVPSIAFTRDGTALAIVNGNVIRLRDVITSRFVQTIQEDDSIYSLAVSPDNNMLASGSTSGVINLWDIESGTLNQKLVYSPQVAGSTPNLIWSVAFSPNGRHLASAGSDSLIRIWDTSKGALLATLAGHSKPVTRVDFHPNGNYLASGSLDATLRIWAIK